MTKMNMTLFEQIKQQRRLSDGVIEAVKPHFREEFFPNLALEEIQCGDMSSFCRGTNNDLAPDVDIIFLNVPNDESEGYKDWTAVDARELTGKKEGISSLEELKGYDPRLAAFIPQVLPIIESYFEMSPGSARFEFMRTWGGYPGLVFNISLPHTGYGEISFDFNLDYTSGHYGIEHNRRFLDYFERVVDELGSEVAVKLVEDIKLVKQKGKDYARDTEGWVDRTKKLFGFIVEGLFCQRFPPYTYAELMEQILAHEWEQDIELKEHWVGDQLNQIIDAGYSFSELLHNIVRENYSLPKGSWENLLQIAKEYQSGL